MLKLRQQRDRVQEVVEEKGPEELPLSSEGLACSVWSPLPSEIPQRERHFYWILTCPKPSRDQRLLLF